MEARAEWRRRHPRFLGLLHKVDVFTLHALHEPCPYSLFRTFFK